MERLSKDLLSLWFAFHSPKLKRPGAQPQEKISQKKSLSIPGPVLPGAQRRAVPRGPMRFGSQDQNRIAPVAGNNGNDYPTDARSHHPSFEPVYCGFSRLSCSRLFKTSNVSLVELSGCHTPGRHS
jgi:hypothetical protein